jgi:hypothetical protein
VHRAAGGKELASRVKVSEYEPDHVFALHMLEGALPLDARIMFEPTEEGTQIRFRVHGQPTGAMRIAQPLLRAQPQTPVLSYRGAPGKRCAAVFRDTQRSQGGCNPSACPGGADLGEGPPFSESATP